MLFLILLVMIALLTVAWGLGRTPAPRDGVPLGPARIAELSGNGDPIPGGSGESVVVP